MVETVRQRNHTFYKDRLSRVFYNGVQTTLINYYGTGRQITVSHNNHWPQLGAVRGDIGSGFNTVDHLYYERILPLDLSKGLYAFKGTVTAKIGVFGYGNFPAATGSSVSELIISGATAIARTIPTNPLAGMTVALGEIRNDGLPSIIGSQLWKSQVKELRRKSGSEYLNVQFGWVPLAKDVQKLVKSVRESEKIIKQYKRNSGKLIRRRYYFPSETTTTVVTQSGIGYTPKPALVSPLYKSASTSKLTTTTVTTTEKWFSGAYTYHLPLGESTEEKRALMVAEAEKLYGLELTPETLWNLAPWSWAVDWVSNIGDVVSNCSRLMKDSLVLKYGYLMEKTTVIVTYHHTGTVYIDGTSADLTQRFTTCRKQRIRATPYGFGLDMSAFTGAQWAIIAALGISRKPGAL